MTGILICVTCDEGTTLPDEHWLSVRHTKFAGETFHACSPRCMVLWLEKTYRPTSIGVRL